MALPLLASGATDVVVAVMEGAEAAAAGRDVSLNPSPSWWVKLAGEQEKHSQTVDDRVLAHAASWSSSNGAVTTSSHASARGEYAPTTHSQLPGTGAATIRESDLRTQGQGLARNDLSGTFTTVTTAPSAGAGALTSPLQLLDDDFARIRAWALGNEVASLPAVRENLNPRLISPLPDRRHGDGEKGHTLTPDARYHEFRLKSVSFRRWAASVLYMKEERHLVEEMNEIKVTAALVALNKRLLARSFRRLVAGCEAQRAERSGNHTALVHWSSGLASRVLHAWKRVAVSKRPVPLYHPTQIRAVFKWMALCLPDRGDWWRLAATQSSQAAAGGEAYDPTLNLYDTTGFSSANLSSRRSGVHGGLSGSALDVMTMLGSAPRPTSNTAAFTRQVLISSPSPSLMATGMLGSVRVREERLGRLRAYVVSRLAPPLRKLPLLEHGTAILDAFTVVSLFTTWRAMAARTRMVRLKTCHLRLRQSVLRWRRRVREGSHISWARYNVRVLHYKYELARAWFAWKRCQGEQRMVQRFAPITDAFQSLWLSRRTFLRWKAYWSHMRRMRRRAARADRSAMALVFHGWRAVTARLVADNVRRARVQAIVQAHSLRSSFASWVWAQGLRPKLQAAAAFRYERLSRLALSHWKEHTRVVATAARHLLVRRSRRRTLAAWQQAAQRQQRCDSLLYKRHARNGISVLSVWHAWASRHRRAEATSLHFAQVRRTRTLRTSLSCWNARALFVSKLRGWMVQWKSLGLRRAVHHWRSAVSHEHSNRAIMLRVLAILTNGLKARTFGTLKAFLAERRRAKQVQRNVIRTLCNLSLARAVRQWRDSVVRTKKITSGAERAIRRMRNMGLARTFSSWKAHVEAQGEKRRKLQWVVSTLCNMQASACVHTWLTRTREAARARRVMARVVAALQHNKLGQCVRTWRRNASLACAQKRTMLRAVQMMARGSLVRCVQQWHAQVVQARRVRETMRQMLQRMMHHHAHACILKWQERTRRAVRSRAILGRVIARMRNQAAVWAFHAWVHFASERVRQRKLVQHVAAVFLNRRVFAAVWTWRDNALAAKVERSEAARTARQDRIRGLTRTFHAWMSMVATRHEHAAAADALLATRQLRACGVVVAKWRQDARDCHLQRRVLVRMSNKWRTVGLRHAMDTWSRVVQFTRRMESLRCQASKFDRRRLLAGVLRLWRRAERRTTAIRTHVPVLVTSVARSRLRAAFLCWREGQVYATRIARALERAAIAQAVTAAGRALRGWKVSVEAEKRMRYVTQCGADMSLRHRTSAAIGVWRESTRRARILARISAAFSLSCASSVFLTWKAFYLERKHNKTAAQRLAQLWLGHSRQHLLLLTFSALKARTEARRADNAKSAAIQAAVGTRIKRSAVTGWRALCAAACQRRAALRRGTFTAWRAVRIQRQTGRQWSERLTVASHATVLRAWLEVAREQQRLREDVVQFTHRVHHSQAGTTMPQLRSIALRWLHVGAAPAFTAWLHLHQRHLHKRHQVEVADALHRRHVWKRGVGAWNTALHLASCATIAAEFHASQVRSLGFRALSQACAAKRASRRVKAAKLGAAAEQHRRTLLLVGWDALQFRIAAKREAYRLAARNEGALAAKAALSCLRMWRRKYVYACVLAHAEDVVSTSHRRSTLRNTLSTWLEAAGRQRHLRHLVYTATIALGTRRAVLAWVAYATECRRLRALAVVEEAVQAACTAKLLATSVDTWRRAATRRRLCAAIIASAETHHRRQQQATALAAWGSYVSRRLTARAAIVAATSTLARQQLVQCVARWQVHTNARLAVQFKVATIQNSSAVASACSAFTKWCAAHAAVTTMRRCITTLERVSARRQLAMALSRWSATATYESQLDRVGSFVRTQHIARTLASAVKSWRATVAWEAMVADHSLRLHIYREDRTRTFVLATWRARFTSRRRLRADFQSWSIATNRTSTAAVLSAWRTLTRDMHAAKLHARCVVSRQRRFAATAFLGWRIALREAKVQRFRSAQAARTMQLVLSSMRRVHQRRLHGEAATIVALQRVEARIAKESFSVWLTQTRVLVHLKRLQARRDALLLAATFDSLRWHAIGKQAKRARLTALKEALTRGVAARALLGWHAAVGEARLRRVEMVRQERIRVGVEERVRKRRLALLRVVFARFRLAVVLERKGVSLRASVTSRTATRCWRAWNALVRTRRRHARNAAQVQAMVLRRGLAHMSDAFIAWRQWSARQRRLRSAAALVTCELQYHVIRRWHNTVVAIRHANAHILRQRFAAWFVFSEHRAQRRAARSLAAQKQTRQTRQRRAILLWRTAVALALRRRARLQQLETICIKRERQRCMLRTLLCIKTALVQRVRLDALHRLTSRQATRHAVRVWVTAARAAMRAAARERKAALHYRKRIMRHLFLQWKATSFRIPQPRTNMGTRALLATAIAPAPGYAHAPVAASRSLASGKQHTGGSVVGRELARPSGGSHLLPRHPDQHHGDGGDGGMRPMVPILPPPVSYASVPPPHAPLTAAALHPSSMRLLQRALSTPVATSSTGGAISGGMHFTTPQHQGRAHLGQRPATTPSELLASLALADAHVAASRSVANSMRKPTIFNTPTS